LFQDQGRAPSSGRAFAVVGEGSAPRLYIAGWVGSPHASRWAQVGPAGTLLWTNVDRPAGGVATGAAGLALAADGTGFGVGLEGQGEGKVWLTAQRFA
jgi:hypothetical protein